MHLTRFHGVFAPHSKLRAAVTPSGRGKGHKAQAEEGAVKPSAPPHVAMSWARRLKRVLGIEIDCERSDRQPHQSELPLGARAPPAQSRLI